VILGRSGSGKSVLIKCIVGLMPFDGGSLTLFGKEINTLDHLHLDEVRTNVGFLFQSSALFDSMTVKENIQFVLKRRFPLKKSKEIEKETMEVLENVGLVEAIHLIPSELSGGMKKRIGLARALVMKPQVMLYDEPTTGLDTITSKEISQLILDVQKKYKTSSIIITHDMKCAKITENKMILLAEGKAYAEGSYQEMENSTDSKIRSFFE
jgi:phospholipid/cholesterol/gamma-HCH transport system ATP-binding protein